MNTIRYNKRSKSDTPWRVCVTYQLDGQPVERVTAKFATQAEAERFAANLDAADADIAARNAERDQRLSDLACDRAAAKRHPMFRERW